MALVIERPGRVLGAAALIGAALLAVGGWLIYPYAKWFYQRVPVIEFKPACRIYEPRDFDDVHYVGGEPTEEFWDELMDHRREIFLSDPLPEESIPPTIYPDGKLYMPISFFYSIDRRFYKMGGGG